MIVNDELIAKVLELNKNGKTLKEIKEFLGLKSIRGIQSYLNKNKIPLKINFRSTKVKSNIPSKNKKYQCNSEYFENIDTWQKAYILGFTYADGCVYDRKRFGYCITEKDREILDLIKFEISPESIITTIQNSKGAKNRQPQCILRIGDVKLVDTLVNKWGVCERKTLNPKLVFPELEEKLMWNFIKGLIDGDGCLYYKESKVLKSPSIRINICMTDNIFLDNFKEYCSKFNIHFISRQRKGKTCTYYLLELYKREEVIKFCEKLYSNSLFHLERKEEKYLTLLENTVLNLENKKSKSV